MARGGKHSGLRRLLAGAERIGARFDGHAAALTSDRDIRDAGALPAEAALDLLGLKCPLPVLKTRRALSRLKPGATLVVVADDPLAGIDIPHLVRERGDELLAETAEGQRLRFVIRRGRHARRPNI